MTLTVFGGDERSVAAAIYFSGAGYETSVYALDLAELPGNLPRAADPFASDAIVFPLPFCDAEGFINCPFSKERYPVVDVFSRIRPRSHVFCGAASSLARSAAKDYSVDLTDYYECEDLQVKNSVPTAEGAIFEFMKRKKKTVFASKCAVTGYGKIGRRVADRLKALGARVTVSVRSDRDLACAISNGMTAVAIDEYMKSGFDGDCIFNTVPCNIYTEDFVAKCGADTLYIELASRPYGMSETFRKILGDRHVFANSLPGKYAPHSAGRIIAETVCKYI